VFLKFFDKVVVANFEIASDAFSTFKVRRAQCSETAAVERASCTTGEGALGYRAMKLLGTLPTATWIGIV
jgi:hypothetical protein